MSLTLTALQVWEFPQSCLGENDDTAGSEASQKLSDSPLPNKHLGAYLQRIFCCILQSNSLVKTEYA